MFATICILPSSTEKSFTTGTSYWTTGFSTKFLSEIILDIIWFVWLAVFLFCKWAQFFILFFVLCGGFNSSFLYLNVSLISFLWVSVPSLCFASWNTTANIKIMKQWMVSFWTTWTCNWVYWRILFLLYYHNTEHVPPVDVICTVWWQRNTGDESVFILD